MRNTFFYFITITALSACSAPIKVHFTASNTINPNLDRSSLPLTIRIYQLSDQQRFNKASLRQLAKQDEQLLGEHLLTAQEFTLFAQQEEIIKLRRHPDAQYLAILALFRHPNNEHWRLSKELSSVPFWPNLFNVSIDTNRIREHE